MKIKTNIDYYNEIVDNMNVFMTKSQQKTVKNAIKTLKNRINKGLKNGEINSDEYEIVMKWLENVKKWAV